MAETGVGKEYKWTCKAAIHATKTILSIIGNHDALAYGHVIGLNTIGSYEYSFPYKHAKIIAYNDKQYEFSDVPKV